MHDKVMLTYTYIGQTGVVLMGVMVLAASSPLVAREILSPENHFQLRPRHTGKGLMERPCGGGGGGGAVYSSLFCPHNWPVFLSSGHSFFGKVFFF
jgi:hypothetical protein